MYLPPPPHANCSFTCENNNANQLIIFVAFLQFNASELEIFLGNDNLNVNSETQAFEALLKWICYDKTDRLQNVKSLIAQIRLPLLPKQYLTENVMKQEILRPEGNVVVTYKDL